MKKPAVLMISNFLADSHHNRNIWHSLSQRLMDNGWDILTTSARHNRILRLIDMVWTVVHQRARYDLAHIDVFSGKAFIFAEFCSGLLQIIGKPFILALHGGRLPEFAQKNQRRVHALLKKATVVISPSHFQQFEFKKFRPDILLIPNPIDLSASIFRHRALVEPKLIWVRAFHEIYNPLMAVEVVHRLCEAFPSIHLTMVGPDKGDGSLNRMLEQAEKLGVLDHIRVIPGVPHSEVPHLLDQADIFINTSNYDTSPRSILEAMANGLCIVSTNVGGIPFLVQDQKEALLAGFNQVDAMADDVLRILTDNGLAAQLSQNARLKAEQFGWDVILAQWERVYSMVYEDFHGEV